MQREYSVVPVLLLSCRHCIVKYNSTNSLSYACIHIPGSPKPPKWISCGLFLWMKYTMKGFWQSYLCRSEFSTYEVAPVRRILRGQTDQPVVRGPFRQAAGGEEYIKPILWWGRKSIMSWSWAKLPKTGIKDERFHFVVTRELTVICT